MSIENVLTLDSQLYTNKPINEKITMMSDILLNNTILSINKQNYRLVELEYYIKSTDHPDPFVHCDPHQQIKHKWYFHRLSGKGYKGGTYKGLDITIGYTNKLIFGGILIRSIQNIETKEIIEGPCKIVNKILETCNKNSIEEFIENKPIPLSVEDPMLNLIIDTTNVLNKMGVFYGPRVGLTLKKSRDDIYKYIMKNYRATTYPEHIKVFKTGIIIKLYNDGLSCEQIKQSVGGTIKNISKYIEFSKQGQTMDFKDFVNVNLNVEKLCNLQGLWFKTNNNQQL
jgi:hypothetical protein